MLRSTASLHFKYPSGKTFSILWKLYIPVNGLVGNPKWIVDRWLLVDSLYFLYESTLYRSEFLKPSAIAGVINHFNSIEAFFLFNSYRIIITVTLAIHLPRPIRNPPRISLITYCNVYERPIRLSRPTPSSCSPADPLLKYVFIFILWSCLHIVYRGRKNGKRSHN